MLYIYIMGRRKKGEDDSTIKKRLIESMAELFFARGVSLTMDEASRSFQISKKTLYRMFPSKEDIILDVARVFADRIAIFVKKMIAKCDTRGPDSFISIVKEIAARIGTFRLSMPAEATQGLEKSSPLLAEKINGLQRDTIMNTFGSILEKGRALGYVRADIDIELASFLYAAMLERISSRGGFGPSRAQYDVYLTAVKIIFVGVLQADKNLEFDVSDLPRLKVGDLWRHFDSNDDADAEGGRRSGSINH